MKIDGPNKTSGTKSASRANTKKSVGDTGFSGLLDGTEETQAQASVSGSAAVSRVDALLSLQEAADGTSEEAGRKGKQRAASLLDQLERVRMGLLAGELPVSTLKHLQQTIAQRRDKVMDPQLAEILDDIDLRAQVELAKYGI